MRDDKQISREVKHKIDKCHELLKDIGDSESCCKKHNKIRVIYGIDYYKRIISGKSIVVPSLERGHYDINGYKYIPFFTDNWKVMPPTLEGIMNLICGGKSIAFEVISILIGNNILPEVFAEYLYDRHNLVLINHMVNGISQLNQNRGFLNSNKCSKLLFLGDEYKSISDLVDSFGSVLHPSGYNYWNDDYESIWVNLDYKVKGDIKLSDFNVFG